jgi:hypothetical protein
LVSPESKNKLYNEKEIVRRKYHPSHYSFTITAIFYKVGEMEMAYFNSQDGG